MTASEPTQSVASAQPFVTPHSNNAAKDCRVGFAHLGPVSSNRPWGAPPSPPRGWRLPPARAVHRLTANPSPPFSRSRALPFSLHSRPQRGHAGLRLGAPATFLLCETETPTSTAPTCSFQPLCGADACSPLSWILKSSQRTRVGGDPHGAEPFVLVNLPGQVALGEHSEL